ncbi:hypothetical protein LV564_04180 [Komagataeibacter nataicola]|uniref:hypothetical protein n=1 Tax=Komagataeibacter nataicola TaxID=265960 RepID=UPI0023DCF93E|nr:hypothetical protein [Komagataeibacter nataicola]WEQ56303.1 hypothetical protein LV564_04180 [Komagataeibacter nataicola]
MLGSKTGADIRLPGCWRGGNARPHEQQAQKTRVVMLKKEIEPDQGLTEKSRLTEHSQGYEMKKITILAAVVILTACAHKPHHPATPDSSITARQGIEPQSVHTARFGAMSRTASYATHHANQNSDSADEKK